MSWIYRTITGDVGPVDNATLADLAASGVVRASTQVRAESSADFVDASTLPWLSFGEAPQPSTKPCRYCAEPIARDAIKCKHCSELQTAQRPVVIDRSTSSVSPGLAAVLGVVLPGLGHIYTGRLLAGFVWMACTVLGYALIVPGLLLHVISVFRAYSLATADAD